MKPRQTTSTLLMIRPAAFGFNPETAESNAFQAAGGDEPEGIHERALAEFDGLVQALRDAGVEVLVFEDTPDPETPDAMFPNNWVSFHANGDVFLYPMLAPSRRAEVRRDILDRLVEQHGFVIKRVVDLTDSKPGEFLEGTGSVVLDHLNRLAFAALSARTHPAALASFCRDAAYEAVPFHTRDARGAPVYHTNVVLCVGRSFAMVCADAIHDERERDVVLARLTDSGRDVVEIDLQQMEAFAGNMLEVQRSDGGRLVVASERARGALRADQRETIERHARFVTADLATIETYGGGSARCMLAEVFLPRS